ncbi:MAG: hypothetical protein ACRD5H_05440 [Nitrososphaerales archaeon]
MHYTASALVVIVALASLVLVIPNTNSAFACMCALSLNPHDELKKSTAVFYGKVIDVHEDASGNRYEVRFDVERSWKGVSGETVAIFTALDSDACGYAFEADEKYLVYAYETEGSLYTTICSRTAPLADAQGDLNVLGPTWQTYKLNHEGYTIKVAYRIASGDVRSMEADPDFPDMIISVSEVRSDGVFTIVVPRSLVDSRFGAGMGDDDEFIVLIDGEEESYDEVGKSRCFRTISVQLPYDADEIEIVGSETGYNPIPRIHRMDPFYVAMYKHDNLINVEGCTNYSLGDEDVVFEILDQEGKVRQKVSVTPDIDGTFADSFVIEDELAAGGNYTVRATYGGYTYVPEFPISLIILGISFVGLLVTARLFLSTNKHNVY